MKAMAYLEPYRRRMRHAARLRYLEAVKLRDSGLLLKQVGGRMGGCSSSRAAQMVTQGRRLLAAGWTP